MLLGLQQLLLAGGRVGEQLVPALDEGGVARLDGLGLDVLGGQQLVHQRCDVGDALLLEGLQARVERLLLGGGKRDGVRRGKACLWYVNSSTSDGVLTMNKRLQQVLLFRVTLKK